MSTERCDWIAHFTEVLDTGMGKQQESLMMSGQLQCEER